MGKTHYIAVVNNHIWIYKRVASPGSTLLNRLSLVKDTSMDAFMQYVDGQTDNKGVPFNPTGTGDARVLYDRVRNRYTVVCLSIGFDRPGVHYLHVAVSKDIDPNGNTPPFADATPTNPKSYWLSHWNVARIVGDFWDQPGLGQDQNAIIITGNIFGNYHVGTVTTEGGGSYHGSDMFSVPKSLLYAGVQPTQISFFRGLASTIQPPNVLDQNPNSYLISAYESNGGTISALGLYRLTNTASSTPTLYGPMGVGVTSFKAPRSARQGLQQQTYTLSTQDARFSNASTQVGNSLFQVHCVDSNGHPGIRFYEINTAARSLSHIGTYYNSSSSDDFNPSCAADDSGNVYFTWNVTDGTRADGFPEILATYHLASNSSGLIANTAQRAFVSLPSPTFSTDTNDPKATLLRWGDYSATCIDPLYPNRAWSINQYQQATTNWGAPVFSFIPGNSYF